MQVHLDDEQCKGHGVCWSLCPDVFELTDDGYAITLVSEVPEQFVAVVRTAVDQCPEGAISFTD